MRRYDPYVLLGRQASMPPFTDGNFEETKWYPLRTKAICSLLTSQENAGRTGRTPDPRSMCWKPPRQIRKLRILIRTIDDNAACIQCGLVQRLQEPDAGVCGISG